MNLLRIPFWQSSLLSQWLTILRIIELKFPQKHFQKDGTIIFVNNEYIYLATYHLDVLHSGLKFASFLQTATEYKSTVMKCLFSPDTRKCLIIHEAAKNFTAKLKKLKLKLQNTIRFKGA